MTAQRFSTIFFLLVALLALPAAAQAADERAAAKRFADAALRAKVAVNAQRAEIERRSEVLESKPCSDAIGAAPARASSGLIRVYLAALFDVLFTPTLPALRTTVSDLDAIPTEDRALRSGRAAWRASVEAIETVPKLADPCGVLQAWRRAGWTRESAPKTPGLSKALDEASNDRIERKLARAERRLRRLGVSRGAARRFRGETLFSGVEDVIEDGEWTESSTSSPGR